jgi:hypothetical protein
VHVTRVRATTARAWTGRSPIPSPLSFIPPSKSLCWTASPSS